MDSSDIFGENNEDIESIVPEENEDEDDDDLEDEELERERDQQRQREKELENAEENDINDEDDDGEEENDDEDDDEDDDDEDEDDEDGTVTDTRTDSKATDVEINTKTDDSTKEIPNSETFKDNESNKNTSQNVDQDGDIKMDSVKNGENDENSTKPAANGSKDLKNNTKEQKESDKQEIIPTTTRGKLLYKARHCNIIDIVPFVAIPYASPVHSIELTKGPKILFTGGEDGFIRKFDFVSSIEGRAPLTVAQRHQLVDSIANGGMLLSYWENEQPMYKDDMFTEIIKQEQRSKISKKGKANASSSAAVAASEAVANIVTPGALAKANTEITSFDPKISPVYSMAAQSESLWLLSGLRSGGITLQSVRHSEGNIQHYFKNGKGADQHSDTVSCLKLNSFEDKFLSGSWDMKVLEWDLNTGKVSNSFQGSTGQISSINYRPIGGTDLYVANEERKKRLKEEKKKKNDDDDDEDEDLDSLFGDDDDDEDEDEDDEDKDVDDDDGLFGGSKANRINKDSSKATNGGNGNDDDSDLSESDLSDSDLSEGGSRKNQKRRRLESRDKLTMNGMLKMQEELLRQQKDVGGSGQYDGLKTSDYVFSTSSINGSINIWDSRSGGSSSIKKNGKRSVIDIPLAKNSTPWCMSSCWSNDGDSIFVGRRNAVVEEFDIKMFDKGPKRTLKFPLASGPVSVVKPLFNGHNILCGSVDNIRLYDLRLHREENDTEVNGNNGSAGSAGSNSATNSGGRRKQHQVPFMIIPGHNGGTLSDLYIDPTCRFMVSASGSRGWNGRSTDYVFVYEIQSAQI
ncbi:hypothetical protein B5S31_g2507 [[Candida] boidinii]|nr:hypothetical protein B5S31_g2507 [[Candida] boidinii]